jgi:hypothetical protein
MSDSDPIDRRRFLEATALGTLVGATGAGGVGCGGAQHRFEAHEANRLRDRLERGLEAVRSEPMPRDLAATEGGRNLARVTKLGIEALIVADVARSVPKDAEVPSHLAEALSREMPILDRCVETYGSLLANVPRSVRRSVDQKIRERPQLVMDFAEEIDAMAGRHQLSQESRLRLRQLATNISRRVKRQSSDALIDDTVGKVERIVARSGRTVSFAREASSQALLASIWQTVDGPQPSGAGVAAPPGPPVPPPPPSSSDADDRIGRLVPGPLRTDRVPEQELSFEYSTGSAHTTAGWILLGSGAAVFGIATLIGALTGSAALGAVVGATPGGIMVILGFIFLGVGAVRGGTPH